MTELLKEHILELARRAIRTERESLANLEQSLGDSFAEAVQRILSSEGKCIVTGMGKSGLVGRKIAATLASTGTPSFFLHPGEAFHGDLGMISKEDVVLALSYSGETDEVLKIVPFIQANGNTLIAMTGNEDSTLARHADIHLNVHVESEACILQLAPTSSTTAQLAMGDALAVALMELRGFSSVDFARLHPGGSLGRRLLMTVGQAMRDHDLPIVTPDCSAVEMIHAISKGGLGLIVLMDAGTIRGIVTDGDVRRAMERLKEQFFSIRAMDIATTHPKTIRPEAKLIEAERQMARHKVTSLLVVDEAESLQGVIQIYDIKL
ncbi:MAG: KpsF/GutQ family sugar-phosphate isomerase [Alistipes sp.]|nr:KpsF/GutQ family sugar-phosphate isomerase [Alistipes sp.]MBO5351265.1 KpsF/GutQ family sugar-phosphate isomerase [Alistipes sp.]MBQ3187360.1 KpsF/GutQ family sugar-phosphate isomerase [Alistipes sp.]MBQ7296750.1 KpsF/GutQ family sugar-phosphate isomerase [Alistipes sp.]